MAAETVKHNDIASKSSTESHANHALHKEAVADLSSSKAHGPADKPTEHKPAEHRATEHKPSADQSSPDKSNAVHKGTDSTKVEKKEISKADAHQAPQAKPEVTTKNSNRGDDAKVESLEKGKLTSELKAAIEHSAKVIVKMPAEKGVKADLVVKTDGRIIHTLDMDPKRPSNDQLTVGVEKESQSSTGISKAQSDAVAEIVAYGKSQNKDVSFGEPKAPIVESEKSKASTGDDHPQDDKKSETKASAHATKSEPQEIAVKAVHQPTHDQGHGHKPTPSHSENHSVATNAAHHPAAQSAERPLNFSPAPSPSDRSYSSMPPTDSMQMNFKELLSEWFTSNPEKFKQLMPDLYNALLGPDGKLDMQKLGQMEAAGNPLLDGVRRNLPAIAAEFPPSKTLNGSVASLSSDAISPIGGVLADKASQVASELGGSGYCAKGVSTAIERATGKSITGNANDMRESLPKYGFSEAPSKELKVGQIVHVSWTPDVYAQERAKRGNCPNYGDIAVIGKGKDGQLYAFNDHATPLQDYLGKARYDWNTLKVFNPPVA